MEKILDGALGLIEVLIISGLIGYGGISAFHFFSETVRKETIDALKHPTPSLSRFSEKLTR
jgi:hypothetical protein